MEKTMKARVQHKHDIEANWLKATNFIPLASEIIVYDPDENYDYPRIKIGDGKTNINALPFVTKDYAKISDIPTKPEDIGALPDSTVIPTVPTKISAFENDKGYLTQHQSLDAYAKTADLGALATKDSLTASEVGALPSTTKIPGALSDLSEDTTHRVVTDAEKEAWNAKSNFSGSYNDLTNKPTIPSVAGLASTTYVDDAVKNKVDKDSNKVLSTNDYTTAEKNKLANIAAGAEVNVNADWNATSGDAQILNKPILVSAFTNDAGYLTEHQSLAGLATETYVNNQIAAIPTPDVSGQINNHNIATDTHNDIRLLINGLTTRLNTLANSDDTTLDQMSEVVAYIKNNKSLIEGVTNNKVNVSDIINNLTTNVSNKPLSAAQGVALKALIDAIVVPTKVSQLENDSKYLTSFTETDPTVPAWAKASSKPSYTKSEVGLGNVDNVRQYSASNPPVVAQATAPTDTSVVWVDTDDNTVDEFQDAVNLALAQAKASGEFTPAKGVDYFTAADQEAIVQQVIIALGTPVFGRVDADNNIILTGELANGTYTLKYEDAEGEQTVIGELALGGITNLADPKSADWKTDYRLNSSCATTPCAPCEVTNFIPCKVGDVIRVKGMNISNYYSNGVGTALARTTAGFFAENKTTVIAKNVPADGNGWVNNGDMWTYTVGTSLTSVSGSSSDIRYCRMCGILYDGYTVNDVIITVNEEIV